MLKWFRTKLLDAGMLAATEHAETRPSSPAAFVSPVGFRQEETHAGTATHLTVDEQTGTRLPFPAASVSPFEYHPQEAATGTPPMLVVDEASTENVDPAPLRDEPESEPGMKWYFSLSEASINRPEHGWRDLIRVAVESALRNTSLRPHMIYDGEENSFIEELRAQGVTVIHRRVSFHDALAKRGPGYLAIASGAFLRVEIPEIEHEDEFVLYTDCDVMFRSNPCFNLKPTCFAAAPQTSQTDYIRDMNTGVMLMNVPALRADLPRFREFIIENFEAGWPGCDQENYRRFYAGRWEQLESRFNWKPYWGNNPDAVIVHWHGPKPMVVHKLVRDPMLLTDRDWKRLYGEATDSYAIALDEWDAIARHVSKPSPRLVVDEATGTRVRGWALDREDPSPLFLRFLVDGVPVWEGPCDGLRPDVMKAGHPVEHVGFDFTVPETALRNGPGILTIQNSSRAPQQMMFGGRPHQEITLERVAAMVDA